MSVLVYTESSKGIFKKNTPELVSYGSELSKKIGVELFVLVLNVEDCSMLSQYGATNILKVDNDGLNLFENKTYSNVITKAVNKINATHVVLSSSADSKYLAPSLCVELDAGYLSNVVELPSSISPFTVKRTCYTNKALSDSTIESNIKIIGLSNNSYGVVENKTETKIHDFDVALIDKQIEIKSIEKASGKISIADADVVVSGGRGLKGPENWNLIEDLAETLGAATACSKPVSDMGWRPHSEHVGQTGKPVATNLYIAVGISGAIQHLAGINSSKVKVVINNDPEAPFFKAADYGVVGDAFEVVPKLNEKLKAFKS